MIALTISSASIPRYIPTTILGLIGLLFAYLYNYFQSRDKREMENVKSLNNKDRARATEMMLNDLGITIETDSLTPDQKYDLVKKLLQAKT